MISLGEALAASGGRWLRCPLPLETPLRAGAFDTRALAGADIFFALAGERSDGHRYLSQLAGTGIRLAVVSQDVDIPAFTGAILRVEDTREALGRMARFLVDKFRPLVVAITGSYGKTTTKEVVAHVLEGGMRLLKTPGSFNNEIGVPLTLLRLDGSQEAVVLEFAARRPGDIRALGAIAPPDIAILLNVGHAHLGVFGSREAIYRAKAEIFEHLRAEGLAVVGAEDPRLRELAAGHRRATLGTDGDYRAEGITFDALGRQCFTAVHGATRLSLQAGIPGPHGHVPLLAAWAVAREAGLPDSAVSARGAFHPQVKGRAVLISAPGGATVIDDTYNASPETVVNLIRTLAALGAADKLLVLGHLSELEEGLRASLAVIAPHLTPPLAELWVHDPARPETAAQFRAAARGLAVRDFSQLPELIAALRGRDRPGTAIGIKGSRAAHMERAVQGLLGTSVTCRLPTCGLLMHCTDCEALTRA